jgi:glutamate racemase
MSKSLGVFDSGIGGLSLVRDIHVLFPELNIFYIADHEYMPYGEKTIEVLNERAIFLSKKLIEKYVSAILVACNTATTQTIKELRSHLSLPIIGVEPFVNAINLYRDLGKTGLILTSMTAQSERFKELIDRFDSSKKIFVRPLINLARLIEESFAVGFLNEEKINLELSFLRLLNLNTLILGCTHYSLISAFIEKEYSLRTISPNLAVAKQVGKVLDLMDLNNANRKANDCFEYLSTPETQFSEMPFSRLNF